MSLPAIYATPTDDDSWQRWSFNHAANHYGLVGAARTAKNAQLSQFALDPFDQDDPGLWFYMHQTMHDQINSLLGSSGFNLLELDWKDPQQFAAWLQFNGDEHLRFSGALNVG